MSDEERRQPTTTKAHTRPDAAEQVATEIQHYIQRGGLVPGDRLGREEDLVAMFGVSRPTLREALKTLAGGGMIRSTKGPGGGIFVANTAEASVQQGLSGAIGMMLETGAVALQELLDARILLEVPLAGLAAYQTDARTVKRLRDGLRAVAESDSQDMIVEADAEIHRTIAAAADNRIIEALTGWVLEVLQPSLAERLEGAVMKSAMVEQHEHLLDALERSDGPRAERAMKDHLLYLRDVLEIVQSRDGSDGAGGGNTDTENGS